LKRMNADDKEKICENLRCEASVSSAFSFHRYRRATARVACFEDNKTLFAVPKKTSTWRRRAHGGRKG